MRLLFIRHAESTWNAVGRWQGQADPPLTSLGVEQAGSAGSALRELLPATPVATYASDLTRAHDTAKIISELLGAADPVVEPLLRERSAGRWSGLTRAEINLRYPGYLADGRRPPDYEADRSVRDRCTRALQSIIARQSEAGLNSSSTQDEGSLVGDDHVLVVTHGGIIMQLEASMGETGRGRIANLGGVAVDVLEGRPFLGERVALLDVQLATRHDIT